MRASSDGTRIISRLRHQVNSEFSSLWFWFFFTPFSSHLLHVHFPRRSDPGSNNNNNQHLSSPTGNKEERSALIVHWKKPFVVASCQLPALSSWPRANQETWHKVVCRVTLALNPHTLTLTLTLTPPPSHCSLLVLLTPTLPQRPFI